MAPVCDGREWHWHMRSAVVSAGVGPGAEHGTQGEQLRGEEDSRTFTNSEFSDQPGVETRLKTAPAIPLTS